jgi:hypothetical protein
MVVKFHTWNTNLQCMNNTKKCAHCEEFKELTEFYKSKLYKDGFRSWCKLCCSKQNAQYRKDHPDRMNKFRDKFNKQRPNYQKEYYQKIGKKRETSKRLQNRNFLWSLKDKPCADCGIKYHPIVMDFDHLPQFKKNHEISRLAKTGDKEAILAEIAKCELVCANCHRMRTLGRLNQT